MLSYCEVFDSVRCDDERADICFKYIIFFRRMSVSVEIYIKKCYFNTKESRIGVLATHDIKPYD